MGRPSSGWTPTNLPRLRSSTRSRRRSRVCVTPSSPSCMRMLEVLQEECPEECLTWEAWAVHQVLELLEELAVLVHHRGGRLIGQNFGRLHNSLKMGQIVISQL